MLLQSSLCSFLFLLFSLFVPHLSFPSSSLAVCPSFHFTPLDLPFLSSHIFTLIHLVLSTTISFSLYLMFLHSPPALSLILNAIKSSNNAMCLKILDRGKRENVPAKGLYGTEWGLYKHIHISHTQNQSSSRPLFTDTLPRWKHMNRVVLHQQTLGNDTLPLAENLIANATYCARRSFLAWTWQEGSHIHTERARERGHEGRRKVILWSISCTVFCYRSGKHIIICYSCTLVICVDI